MNKTSSWVAGGVLAACLVGAVATLSQPEAEQVCKDGVCKPKVTPKKTPDTKPAPNKKPAPH